MALIVLTSASGSPGVSTSALGLALAWPRPVLLVDADPTGSRSIPAGYLRGGQLPTADTIVDLAVPARQGTLTEDLPRMLIDLPGSSVQMLCGPRRHTQARALSGLWEPLAAEFKRLELTGQDVIVDAGRLGLEGSPMPLLLAADLTLLATRSSLPALVAASSWAPTLLDSFTQRAAGANLGALLIGAGRPYRPAEVAKVLGLPVLAALPWDPPSAQVFSEGATPPRRKFEQAPLPRALRSAVPAVQTTITESRPPTVGVAAEEEWIRA